MTSPSSPFELVVGTVELTVPRDALLTLRDAADLPRLNGYFDAKRLYRAVRARRLRASQPFGKGFYTTPDWINDWIESSCPRHPDDAPHDASGPPIASGLPASGGRRGVVAGRSSTQEKSTALLSALTRARKLSGN